MLKTRMGLLIGACVGSMMLLATVASASAPPCASVTKRIESGSPGPLNCSAGGVATVEVARHTTLPLKSMSVAVTGTRTTGTLVDKIDGVTISHATAQGMFVVVTVRVSNRTHKPQLFNGGLQTELVIGPDTYSVSTKQIGVVFLG
jgi:hypothetical protein